MTHATPAARRCPDGRLSRLNVSLALQLRVLPGLDVRVTIADVEESAFDKHREIHRDALNKPVVIHVSAVTG